MHTRIMILVLLFIAPGVCGAKEPIFSFGLDKPTSTKDQQVVLGDELTNVEGAIRFWVKSNGRAPQSILSVPWGDRSDGYMVISDGWWEKNARSGLYFVVDNQAQKFCFIDGYSLPENKWVMVTATWKNGVIEKYCRIYINDELSVERKLGVKKKKSSSRLELFSDKATDDPRHRIYSGKVYGLAIYGEPLSNKEVAKSYAQEKALLSYVSEYRFKDYLEMEGSEREVQGEELRVMFDEDIYWALSKENTDDVLELLTKAKINVFIPCVWHGRGAYYPVENAPIDERVKKRILIEKEDPLQYLIRQAKKRGIEVHPWFTVVRREKNILPQFATAGIEGAFDIHNGDFRIYISSLIADVVSRYDVDGINLDYIRSMGFCSTAECQKYFSDTYGKKLKVELLKEKIPGYVSTAIRDWNGKSMEKLVDLIREKINEKRKGIVLSVDAHPINNDLLLQGQDSISWANAQAIDIIFDMHYEKDIKVKEIITAKSLLKDEKKLVPLFSLYDISGKEFTPRPAGLIESYVELSRSAWEPSGVAFYHRKRLSKEQLYHLRAGVFREKVKSRIEK